MNEFEKRIKDIESELLNLKTATEYTSTRSLTSAVIEGVYTGMYLISYLSTDGYIASVAACDEIDAPGRPGESLLGQAYLRTPNDNTQIVEVDTDYYNFDTRITETGTCSMMISSNVPITGITRIS